MSDKLLLISADSHAGGMPEDYRDHFEPEYRGRMDDLIAENNQFLKRSISQDRYSKEQLDRIDERGAIRGGGLEGGWNVKRRLQEMDGEGVAAELLNPGHQSSTLPFFNAINKPCSADLRAAGARAYHRWLAEGMAGTGGRLVGTADPGPCHDMAATVRELQWVAEHGFVSVQPPGAVADSTLPPMSDAHYEPFWSTCVETGLVLNAHIGHGFPQMDRGAMMMENPLKDLPTLEGIGGNEEDKAAIRREKNPNGLRDVTYTIRRYIWRMMMSGVLDRHPALKIVLSEVRADWVPATIAFLDKEFERGDVPMKLKPSEYWARNFYVAPSSPRDYEVAMRHDIGVKQLLMATDYPHPEGTWPNTINWMRAAFVGVAEADARLLLGENALACFSNMDGPALRKVAQKIGPSVQDILGAGPVSRELLEDFHRRSGYLTPKETVDTERLASVLQEDVKELAPA
jgi:predicted TIM-barrel fold metal-dependent hydrolase